MLAIRLDSSKSVILGLIFMSKKNKSLEQKVRISTLENENNDLNELVNQLLDKIETLSPNTQKTLMQIIEEQGRDFDEHLDNLELTQKQVHSLRAYAKNKCASPSVAQLPLLWTPFPFQDDPKAKTQEQKREPSSELDLPCLPALKISVYPHYSQSCLDIEILFHQTKHPH